ncbi:MAG: hypothetical protein OET44_01145 [Gammaproteobacteria bacterium]|nr:hypothetical protein [Gammaproteobacteria bacterium]
MLKLMARNIGTFVLAALFGLSGCVNSEQDDPRLSVPNASYQGSTSPADIDGNNATVLTKAVIGINASRDTLPMAAPAPESGAGVITAIGLLRSALAKQGPVIAVAGVHPLVSVMQACDDGGEIVATTEGHRLTVDYFHCAEDGVTIVGSVRRNGGADDFTATIYGIRLTAPGLDLSFAGSFSFLDSGATEILMLTDLVMVDNHPGGKTIRTENLVITQTGDLDGDNVTVDGRLFYSTLGYIEIETADGDPLFVADGDDYPSGGLLTLTGQNGETVVIMPLSSTQVNFMVDADGVAGAEIDQTVTWAEVEAAIGLA